MDYSKELEHQFSPSKWSKRYPEDQAVAKHVEFVTKASFIVRNQIPCELNITYGSRAEEKLDIFGTHLPYGSPIFVYVHGGYWQELNRTISSYLVNPLVKFGFKVIIVGYTLCPKIIMHNIVKQIHSAIHKCIQYAKEHGSNGVHLCGHSAGAHLVASCFPALSLVEQNHLNKVFLISGIYDLTPLTQTYINDALGLDINAARELSPLLNPLQVNKTIEIHVIVAQEDSPVFKKQSTLYYKKLLLLGYRTAYSVVNGVDHFSIVEYLNNENYELVRLIVKTCTQDGQQF